MARKQIGIEAVLEFAATSRGRLTVFWAAIAFAACHIVALFTEAGAAIVNDDLQPQLIHFGAVLGRFVLPFAVMVTGLAGYIASRLRRSAPDTAPRFL
jgi:hypothetical protein